MGRSSDNEAPAGTSRAPSDRTSWKVLAVLYECGSTWGVSARHLPLLAAIPLVLACATSGGAAQSAPSAATTRAPRTTETPYLSRPACDPEIVGVDGAAVIESFVAATRQAMSADGTAEIVALASLPLRVNSVDSEYKKRRSVFIRERAELTADAAAIFSESFRKKILASNPADLFCRDGGVGLANGVLWGVPGDDGILRIGSVTNVDYQWPNMTAEELLRCSTPDRLIVVDRPRDRVRFRSWGLGRPVTDAPSVVVEGGTERFEGTGVCTSSIWSFTDGGRAIGVEDAGCGDPVAWIVPNGTEPSGDQIQNCTVATPR